MRNRGVVSLPKSLVRLLQREGHIRGAQMIGCRLALVLIVPGISCSTLKTPSPVLATAGQPRATLVQAIPPDTVSAALYENGNLTDDYRYAGFLVRDIVPVRFAVSATRSERQTIDYLRRLRLCVGLRAFDGQCQRLCISVIDLSPSLRRLRDDARV